MAAMVLDEGPYKHEWYVRPNELRFGGNGTQHFRCRKCAIEMDTFRSKLPDGPCVQPTLPTEPLEVLAFRCRDKIERGENWIQAKIDVCNEFYHTTTADLNTANHFFANVATPAHWIQAAAKAKGLI
jgi:hypothetical protein